MLSAVNHIANYNNASPLTVRNSVVDVAYHAFVTAYIKHVSPVDCDMVVACGKVVRSPCVCGISECDQSVDLNLKHHQSASSQAYTHKFCLEDITETGEPISNL